MHLTLTSTLHRRWHPAVAGAARFGLSGGAGEHAALVEAHVKAAKPRRFWRVVDAAGSPLLFARRRDAIAHADRHGGSLEVRDISPQSWTSGRAYDGVPGIARVSAGVEYLVTLKVPVTSFGEPRGRYPRTWRYERYATAPPATFADVAEEIVHTAAHEGRHVWQFATEAPRSEIDAEHRACEVLDEWRMRTTGVQLSLF